MSPLDTPALPKGSLVLVTGANGFMGSHVADQFVQYGYRVRGTVRDPIKHQWLADYFEKNYGPGKFEFAKVGDLCADGVWDDAIKGVDAVVHTASVLTFDPNPNNVIPQTIAGAVNLLKAAYAEPSVKRFVLTSSSSAVVTSNPDIPAATLTEDSWNEWTVKEAWADPPYKPERGPRVYGASKTQSEQEVWKFHKENKDKRPDFVVNTVVPNFLFGKPLDPANQGYPSSCAMIPSIWKDEMSPFLKMIAPQYFVDIQDTARLHVAGALFPNVQDQRLFAFGGRFNWAKIIDIIQEQEPDRKLPEKFDSGEDPHEFPPRDKAEQLLKDLGFPGWTTLEDCVANNLAPLRAAA